MSRWPTIAGAALAAILAMGHALAADVPESWDGLVQVKAKRMDAVFVAPGADFRPYTKLKIDPTEVAFHKNWMKDINRATRGVSRDVTERDAEKIAAAVRTGFVDEYGEVFRKAGYEIVTEAGPDVLWLRPAVFNLYINAPDTGGPGRTRTYTVEAGEASLLLEVRDSTSGALLGRVVDRRATRSMGGMRITNEVTNRSDFIALFRQWADTCVRGFDELKSHSPVPEDLKPGQKL